MPYALEYKAMITPSLKKKRQQQQQIFTLESKTQVFGVLIHQYGLFVVSIYGSMLLSEQLHT